MRKIVLVMLLMLAMVLTPITSVKVEAATAQSNLVYGTSTAFRIPWCGAGYSGGSTAVTAGSPVYSAWRTFDKSRILKTLGVVIFDAEGELVEESDITIPAAQINAINADIASGFSLFSASRTATYSHTFTVQVGGVTKYTGTIILWAGGNVAPVELNPGATFGYDITYDVDDGALTDVTLNDLSSYMSKIMYSPTDIRNVGGNIFTVVEKDLNDLNAAIASKTTGTIRMGVFHDVNGSGVRPNYFNVTLIWPMYQVTYGFSSETAGKSLPTGVTSQLPATQTTLHNGDVVTAPTGFTSVHDGDGTWTFTGWDRSSLTMGRGNEIITGKWTWTGDPTTATTTTATATTTTTTATTFIYPTTESTSTSTEIDDYGNDDQDDPDSNSKNDGDRNNSSQSHVARTGDQNQAMIFFITGIMALGGIVIIRKNR